MKEYKDLKSYKNSEERYNAMKLAFRRTAIHLDRHFYLDNKNNAVKIEELFYNISNKMIELLLQIQKEYDKWNEICNSNNIEYEPVGTKKELFFNEKDIKDKIFFSSEIRHSNEIEGAQYKSNLHNETITYDLLFKKIENEKDFNEFVINVLESNDINVSGELYRNNAVYLTSGIETRYEAIDYKDILNKINLLIKKINSDETIFDVLFTHFIFEYIHPFSDGNGRVGRMLLINMLVSKNILPSTVLLFLSQCIKSDTKSYYNCFDKIQSKYQNGDTTTGIEKLLKYILNSIKEAIISEKFNQDLKNKYLNKIKKRIKESKMKISQQRMAMIYYLIELKVYSYPYEYFDYNNIYIEMKKSFPKYTKQNFMKNVDQLVNSQILKKDDITFFKKNIVVLDLNVT